MIPDWILINVQEPKPQKFIGEADPEFYNFEGDILFFDFSDAKIDIVIIGISSVLDKINCPFLKCVSRLYF